MSLVTRGLGHNPKLVSGGLGGVLSLLVNEPLDGGMGGKLQSVRRSFTSARLAKKKRGEPLAYIRAEGEAIPVTAEQYPARVTDTFLRKVPRYKQKIQRIRKELNVPRETAHQALKERVQKELDARADLQKRVFKSDHELIEILIMANVI